MSDRSELDGILSAWQVADADGRDVSLEELCRARPELLPEVEQRVAVLRRIRALAPPAAEADEFIALSVDDTTVSPDELATASMKGDSGDPFQTGPLKKPGGDPSSSERVIDGYRLVRILGEGGMGAVWEAEDVRLRRPVALKMMLPALLTSEKARERFLREARSQAAIHHDHVAVIHAVGEQNGVPYIVMPLLKGETLAARLLRKPGPTFDDGLRIGREIAEGLAAAHAKGLIHRDIKPANIWLEGNAAKVRILDFGLARSTGMGADPTITASGAVLGTPAYMAPEQAAAEEVDGRADLFSLGVVLYEMATGKRPFAGKSTYSVLNALAMHDPPSAAEVNAEVPDSLSELIRGLLIKNAAERHPQSASDVIEIVRLIEAGQAPAPVPVSKRTRVAPRRSVAFPWRPASAVAVVLVLALALAYQIRNLSFAGTDAVTEMTRPEPPPPPPDPFKVATAKLEGQLSQFKKQFLIHDEQTVSRNGFLGIERKNFHHFKGVTGSAFVKPINPEKCLLAIEYSGDYSREGFDLGIMVARVAETVAGRLEFTLQFREERFFVLNIDHQTLSGAESPVDQDSHQCAKKAVERLVQETLPAVK